MGLNLLIEMSTELASFTSSGSWFQRLEPPDEKEWSPSIAVLEEGDKTSLFLVDDQKLETGDIII